MVLPMVKRVLLVDDSDESRYALTALLSLCNVQVIPASNGTEALGLAQQFSPEYALIDLKMPGMDGYDLAAQLRQTHGSDAMKIVAISGVTLDKPKLEQAGIDDFLPKPVLLQNLKRVLDCD